MVVKLDAEYDSTNQLLMTLKLSGIDVILSLERKICIPISHIASVNLADPTIIADRLKMGMSRAVGVRLGGKSIVGAFVPNHHQLNQCIPQLARHLLLELNYQL